MPGGFWLSNALCNPIDIGLNLSGNYSAGTTVAPSTSANTKGAWVQLSAATPSDIDVICLHWTPNLTDASPAISTMMLDIGIGASGQEQVVIPNLFTYAFQFGQYGKNVMLPLHIKAGSRVAARCQTNIASSGNNMNVGITGYSTTWSTNEGVSGYDNITTLSASPPVSTVLQPLTNATKTAWSQVIASTTRDYCGLLFSTDNQATQDNTNFPNAVYDIGIGGAGSEQVIIANMAYNQAVGVAPYEWTFIPLDIKAGTRVAVRMSYSVVTSTFKGGIVLYGAYQ